MNKIFIDSDAKVQEGLDLLDKESILAIDVETNGLDVHRCKLWSIQIGDQNTSLLFPYNALNEDSRSLLRRYCEDKTFIAHNAKFDYKFLYINGFNIKETYCTQEVERVLFAGKYFTFGLKDVLKRRFQIEMDKEVREVFYSSNPHEKSEFQKRVDELGEWGAWTEDVIEYALEDICYLHEIYYSQQEDIKQLGMQNVCFLENHLVPVVGRMEKRGVYMDKVATKKFHSRILKRCDELKANLFGLLEKSYNTSWHREYTDRMQRWDSWKSSHELVVKESNKLRKEGDKRKKTDEGLAMVAESLKKQPYSTAPKLNNPFSPSSPQKMCLALTEVTGFPVTTTNKEWLDENRHLHESIDDLAEFRKYEKLCQFCELTEDINPVTGKIHASFHQNGTKSGRFSCVPMDTKALTKDGWKGYDELVLGEEILSYDMENKVQVWTPLIDKIKLENQAVGSIGRDSRLFRCTDNHNWVIVQGHDGANTESLLEAKDVKLKHRILTNSAYKTNQNLSFDLFSTEKYKTDYSKLITRMSNGQLDTFVLGFLLADGHNSSPTKIGKKKGWQWTQARTVTREQAFLATYLQHEGRIGVGKHFSGDGLNQKPSDRVTLCHSPYSVINKTWEYETTEDVWCPTTKYGTWIMRQGDLITITGNCSSPNLQQIPARGDEAKEFRGLFRPEEGYKFVGADLAGIELVILAYFSGETLLINAINEGLDVHCFTMSLFLNCPYEIVVKAKKDETLEDEEFQKILQSRVEFENAFTIPELSKLGNLTKWVNTLRDYTKTLTYGLAYDLSAWGLSRKFHCNYDDAEAFITLFFSNYPNLKKFLNHEQEIGFDRKYSVNPLGRRRWFTPPHPKSEKQIEEGLIKKLDKEKRLWDSVSDEEWAELWAEAVKEAHKEYKGKIGYIKRQAGNFFPQSMCADMIKLAMVKFDREFTTEDQDEGLWGTIHDEMIASVKDENVDRGARVMEESMVYAVKKFMPDIETKVQAKIMDKWEK